MTHQSQFIVDSQKLFTNIDPAIISDSLLVVHRLEYIAIEFYTQTELTIY